MGSYLNPGNLSFRGSLRSKIYVDKSELIARTNESLCTEQKYICVMPSKKIRKINWPLICSPAYYDRSEDHNRNYFKILLSVKTDRIGKI